jgi:hypothetical protein
MNRVTFEKILAKHGVTWDHEMEDADVIQVDAPQGKIFAAHGCHTIVEQFRNVCGQSWKTQAYAEVARMVNHGLHDCDRGPECDVCHPEV